MTTANVPGTGAGTVRLLDDARRSLARAGLRGSFLVRDLQTGSELALDADEPMPLASLVKVPLALTVLDAIRRGALDGAEPVQVPAHDGESRATGSIGLGRFRYPATVALRDLVYLSMALSDNVATDALFTRTPPQVVTTWLREHEQDGLWIRHPVADLADTPRVDSEEEVDLALVLATRGGTAGAGHRVRQLDVARSSVGTSRAMAALLQATWSDGGAIHPSVASEVRDLMRANVHHQRLWPDLASDSTTWASKTGTVLNLRHEVGVAEHSDGTRFVVSALTESSVPAAVQPTAEATMAQVAKRLHDHLRSG